jgi:hypothetical protein
MMFRKADDLEAPIPEFIGILLLVPNAAFLQYRDSGIMPCRRAS